MALPAVRFTDERLPNGLRLVMSEDHLAPVVAVSVTVPVVAMLVAAKVGTPSPVRGLM